MNEKVFRTQCFLYQFTELIIHYISLNFQSDQIISLIIINLQKYQYFY
jgi:hypothetical protein